MPNASMAELVVDARNGVGESPVWVATEQALYWTDIPARRMHRLSVASGALERWDLPEMAGCMAPHARGGWIAAMETGIFHLHLHGGGLATASRLATEAHSQPGMRFNDGRCDRQGRFLAGTMIMNMAASPRAGCVSRYEINSESTGGGHLVRLLDGLCVPNGMAFSPSGRTMYLSDSHPSVQAVWAFDYDTDTGTPHNRRLFVDMNPLPGRPDGAAVDTEGGYWVCGNDAGLVHRFTPNGRLDRSLAVPVKKPAMCAFGGPGLDTLFVTSIRPQGVDLSDQPLAGGVFALTPGVRGLPEPVFSGPAPNAGQPSSA